MAGDEVRLQFVQPGCEERLRRVGLDLVLRQTLSVTVDNRAHAPSPNCHASVVGMMLGAQHRAGSAGVRGARPNVTSATNGGTKGAVG